ncbi:MAG: META domain-containing protein [Xanthomonadales bacterium]|nr:META domain-containing protein [Xanthomonadales bacterium]
MIRVFIKGSWVKIRVSRGRRTSPTCKYTISGTIVARCSAAAGAGHGRHGPAAVKLPGPQSGVMSMDLRVTRVPRWRWLGLGAVLAAIFGGGLEGCRAVPVEAMVEGSVGAPLAATRWRLAALDGTALAEPQTDPWPYLQFDAEAERMSGHAGCNAFFGSYAVTGAQLSFGPVGATRRMCAVGMDREDRLLEILQGTVAFSIEGAVLVLHGPGGEPVAEFTLAPGNAP